MNEIKDHISTDLRVLKSLGHEIEVDLGDYRAKVGEAIQIGDVLARVVGLPGHRKAIAQVFENSVIATGARIEPLRQPALLEKLNGEHRVKELKWVVQDGILWTPPAPSFMEIDARREVVPSGSGVLDRAYPLVRGGVHMVLDADPDGDVFRALAQRLSSGRVVVANMSFPSECSISGDDDFEKWMAIRVGAAQVSSTQGDATFIFEVPVSTTRRLEGQPLDEIAPDLNLALDQITAGLVSTKTRRRTVMIRVPIWGSDASSYVETLNLGEADTCWFVDGGGVDLMRSTSKHGDATEILSSLDRAGRAASRRELFGEEELSADEWRDIDNASKLVVSIAHLLDVASPEH